MHDQIHNVSEAASSVSAATAVKSVALGSSVIGAGEVAKNSAGGWMLTYFIPVVDINTIQLFQFVGGVYMSLQVYKFVRDEFGASISRFFANLIQWFSNLFSGKRQTQATTKPKPSDRFVVSVNNGKGKPPPRDGSDS